MLTNNIESQGQTIKNRSEMKWLIVLINNVYTERDKESTPGSGTRPGKVM